MRPEEKTFITGKASRNFKHAVKMISARDQIDISEMIIKGLITCWPELTEMTDEYVVSGAPATGKSLNRPTL